MTVQMQTICAVIPAAGRGSRLGAIAPKILSPVGGGRTIWDLLYSRVSPHCEHLQLVLSPSGKEYFESLLTGLENVSIAIQETPLGMGNAVFSGSRQWPVHGGVLVIWGDQVGVSEVTISRVTTMLRKCGPKAIILPLCRPEHCYVDYVMEGKRLVEVRQSREGDVCRTDGHSDVGLFGLTTNGLIEAWTEYLQGGNRGKKTGEINFLPFLAYLSSHLAWTVETLEVDDPTEALGVNTAEDLSKAAEMLSKTEREGKPE